MAKGSTIKTYEAKLIPSAWKRPTKKDPSSIATPSEEAKKQVLLLFVRSTQLCKAVRDALVKHDELDQWIAKGTIPEKVLKAEWETARIQDPFRSMPSRFQSTALFRVQGAFSSWFEGRKSKRRRLDGLQRWLDIVKNDAQLMEISGLDIEQIKGKALKILQEAKRRAEASQAQQSSQKSDASGEKQSVSETSETGSKSSKRPSRSVFSILFDIYGEVVKTDLVAACVISYLLKNQGSIATENENKDAFESRIRKKRKEVERLEKQLNSRLPRFRTMSDKLILDLLNGHEDSDQGKHLGQTKGKTGQRKHSDLPYAVSFYSRDDITWQLIQRINPETEAFEDRIFIKIKGLDKFLKTQEILQPAVFEICCDVRQLAFFKQCYKEWQLYSRNRNDYSTRDFLLQSASLVWKKKEIPKGQRKSSHESDKYEPYLQIAIDTDKLTFENSENKRLAELEAVERLIASYEAKRQEQGLTVHQEKALQNSLTTRRKLENNSFPRRLFSGSCDDCIRSYNWGGGDDGFLSRQSFALAEYDRGRLSGS